jgi:sporulation protein YlmC with PRC-barrel domain
MMTKILAASIAALAFATSPVFAQSSTSPSTPGSGTPGSTMGQQHGQSGQMGQGQMGQGGQATFLQAPQGNQVLATELMNANVYGSDGNSIGDINDILIDRAGQVHGVVFGVGGFLGIGEKNVAVSYNALQITPVSQSGTSGSGTSGSSSSSQSTSRSSGSSDWNSQYRVTLNVTRDQLRSAPEFHAQRTTTTGSLFTPSGTIAR